MTNDELREQLEALVAIRAVETKHDRIPVDVGSSARAALARIDSLERELAKYRKVTCEQVDDLQRQVIEFRKQEQLLIDLWRSDEFSAEGRDGDACNLSPCANAVNVLHKQRTRLNELRAEILESRQQFGNLCARLERGVRGEPGLWPDWVGEAAEAIRHAKDVPWLPDLLAKLEWQGGTIHDALQAVARMVAFCKEHEGKPTGQWYGDMKAQRDAVAKQLEEANAREMKLDVELSEARKECERLRGFEQTVKSLSVMLGWMNVPPQATLETEIRCLRERAEKAEVAYGLATSRAKLMKVAMDVADKEKQRGDNLKVKCEKAEAERDRLEEWRNAVSNAVQSWKGFESGEGMEAAERAESGSKVCPWTIDSAAREIVTVCYTRRSWGLPCDEAVKAIIEPLVAAARREGREEAARIALAEQDQRIKNSVAAENGDVSWGMDTKQAASIQSHKAVTAEGFVDKFEGDVAHVTLKTNSGETFYGEYPAAELKAQGIGEHRRFKCWTVEVGPSVEFVMEPVPARHFSEERERQLDEWLRKSLGDDNAPQND